MKQKLAELENPWTRPMPTITFPKFLINAKLHTYAGGGERTERILYQGKEVYVLSYNGGRVGVKI